MNYSEPLISVIVPIYNTSEYLGKCLGSIINQTYNNLEIILIDDGSTDDSGRICDNYALNDQRIAVVHQENQGVSCSRNRGIALAHGIYTMFVDGDDWVDETICETLLDALQRYSVQSSMCTYVREYSDKAFIKELHFSDHYFEGQLFQRRVCGPIGEELKHPENLDSYSSMCGKLYPTHVLKEKAIVDIRLLGSSEDTLYNFDVFSKIDSLVYINKPLYHYRKCVSGSITSKYRPQLEKQWDYLYEAIRSIISLNSLDETYTMALNNRIALNVLGLGLNCVGDDSGFFQKCKRLRAVLSNEKRSKALKHLMLKHMPIHWKLFFFCARHRFVGCLCFLLIIVNKMRGKT